MSDREALAFPIGDGPWKRMADRVEAIPPGPERTQAIVDMNAMLVERNRQLRSEGLTVERLDQAMAAIGIHVDLRREPPRPIGCNSCRPAIRALLGALSQHKEPNR